MQSIGLGKRCTGVSQSSKKLIGSGSVRPWESVSTSQVEAPGTPLPTDDTPVAELDHSGPEAELGDELITALGKQPQRGGKSPKKF